MQKLIEIDVHKRDPQRRTGSLLQSQRSLHAGAIFLQGALT